MRKITVLSMLTLDGVIQGPGSPEEDRSQGFDLGGWVAPFDNVEVDKVLQEELKPATYLLGRKTFEIWAAYWPNHGEFWPGINEGMKYVFSNSLQNQDPLVADWKNSVVINSVDHIRELKNTEGSDIQVWGSSELVQLLLRYELVDELRMKIYPLILGKGKKLFDEHIMPTSFSLKESFVTPVGVIIANYVKAGEVRTGTIGE